MPHKAKNHSSKSTNHSRNNHTCPWTMGPPRNMRNSRIPRMLDHIQNSLDVQPNPRYLSRTSRDKLQQTNHQHGNTHKAILHGSHVHQQQKHHLERLLHIAPILRRTTIPTNTQHNCNNKQAQEPSLPNQLVDQTTKPRSHRQHGRDQQPTHGTYGNQCRLPCKVGT